jgi:hypothetical protein
MKAIERHLSGDEIELYALGRLAEELVPPLEEHLLVCECCQDALREEESFSQSITALLKDKRQESGGV